MRARWVFPADGAPQMASAYSSERRQASTEADQEAGASERPGGRLPSSRLGVAGELQEKLARDFAARSTGLALPQGEASDGQGVGGGEPEAPDEGAAGGAVGPTMGEQDPFMNRIAELQRVLRDGMVADEAAAGEGGPVSMAQRVEGWQELVTTLKTGVGTIEVPAPKLDRASAYDLHLGRAQEMMKQGRYFEAEQRFTMALAARPRDAIASIGRVHAQLGAGLDLSAAVNLRSFLIEHPEFVAARYEGGMLPGSDRLEAAANRLENQLADEEGVGRSRESALLLAYVSFLREDVVSLRLGLARLGEGRAGERDALVPLLRAVWLDSEAERSPEGGAPADGGQ